MLLSMAATMLIPLSQSEQVRTTLDLTGQTLNREQRRAMDSGGGGQRSESPDCQRWSHSDGGLRWIPYAVGLADHSAAAIAGQQINQSRLAVYAGGDSVPLAEHLDEETYDYWVDGAAEAPLFAVLRSYPEAGDIAAELTVWDSHAPAAPRFEYGFANDNDSRSQAGVGVSRDGSVIVAAWPQGKRDELEIVALDRDGNILAASAFPADSPEATDLEISDDGRRILFWDNGEAILYDVFAGQEVQRFYSQSIFSPISLSGDGRRVAVAQKIWPDWKGSLDVWDEADDGSWSVILHKEFTRLRRVTDLDLDQDGSRLGYLLQTDDLRTYRVRLHDVDEDRRLFTHTYEAPSSSVQNIAIEVKLDDAGAKLAGLSWGDERHQTPEAFVFAESGTILCEVSLRGSGQDLDFSPDGDVLVVGSKAVHANVFGSGGDVTVIDTSCPRLAVRGAPTLGASLELEVQGGVAQEIGAVGLSLGLLGDGDAAGWRLDPLGLIGWMGPFDLSIGNYVQDLDLPNDGVLIGLPIHFQGVFLDDGIQTSNKVSVRISP